MVFSPLAQSLGLRSPNGNASPPRRADVALALDTVDEMPEQDVASRAESRVKVARQVEEEAISA